jgi:hypothetical protein
MTRIGSWSQPVLQQPVSVKNDTLGTIEQVSTQSMSVRTDDGRDIAFDLKDYDRSTTAMPPRSTRRRA